MYADETPFAIPRLHNAFRLQYPYRRIGKQNFLRIKVRAGNRQLAEFLLRVAQMPRKRR